MFSLFKRKTEDFSVEKFEEYRVENPNEDHILAVMICRPILKMSEFMKNEFWREGREIKDVNEALNLVIHYSPKNSITLAMETVKQGYKKHPKTETSKQCYLFLTQFWSEALKLPSFGNGGKADFSILESAKSPEFLKIQKQFIDLSFILDRVDQTEA